MQPPLRALRNLGVLAVTVLLTSPAQAQVYGVVHGVVRAPDSSPLPHVRVEAQGDALQGALASATTDGEGRYRLGALPPGRYSVTATLDGFERRLVNDVVVGIHADLTVDLQLERVSLSEEMTVHGERPTIEIQRTDLSARVTKEALEQLPLNGRNFEDLISLAPGVRPRPEAESGSGFSIFGERPAATGFIVDGADNTDPIAGGPAQRYTQDSIQEFEVVTSGYEAELGRAQGGVVNIVTRSGGSHLAGSAFFYLRDDSVDASNVSDQDVPELRREQLGLSLGGPLSRKRTFFFVSAEAVDENRGRNLDFSQVPTWVTGGLATIDGHEDLDSGPSSDGLVTLGKIDVVAGDAEHLTFSYNRTDDEAGGVLPQGIAGALVLPSAAQSSALDSESFSLRHDWVASHRAYHDTDLRYLSSERTRNADRDRRAEAVLLLLRSGFLQTSAQLPGGRSNRDLKRLELDHTTTLLESWGGRQHEIKLGLQALDARLSGRDEVSNDVEYSAFFLAPDATERNRELFERFGFGHSAARFLFLADDPSGALEVDLTNTDLGLFAQDAWRIADHMTLDLGMRWDYASLFGDDRNNFGPRLGLSWDVGGRHRSVVKASYGVFYDRNALVAAAGVPEKGGLFRRNAFDVALPRLGFAYTDSLIDLVITSGFPLPGGGRAPAENPAYAAMAAALRADPLALYKLLGIAVSDPSAPPLVSADNIEALSGLTADQALALLENTWPGTDWEFLDLPGGSVVGNRVLSFFPRGPLTPSRDVSIYSSDRTPKTEAFSVGFERQMGKSLTLSANYVRRRSTDLLTRRITNLIDVAPGEPGFSQTTDGGPRRSTVTYDGFVDYDGLTVSLRRPLRRRFGFSASYTYSDSTDNLLTGQIGSGFSNNNHPELDIGEPNLSVPNVFVGSVTSSLPFGLRLSGILFWRDGSAFSPRGIVDTDGDGLVDQRDLSVPRNSLRVKDYVSVDLRLEKIIHLPNDQQLTLLIDAFNLTNRANVANVNAVSGPDFGVANDFFPGREVQVGVRYFLGGF